MIQLQRRSEIAANMSEMDEIAAKSIRKSELQSTKTNK